MKLGKPPILVCSAPKAGTYFIASILENLGWQNTGLHFGRGKWQDYSSSNKHEALANPENFTHKGSVNSLIRKLPPSSFAVCHLGPNQISVPKDFIILVALRDLNTALPSYLKFARRAKLSWPDTTRWRTEPDESVAVENLLTIDFPQLMDDYKAIAEWLPTKNIIFFEALIGHWGEAALQSQLTILSKSLNLPHANITQALTLAKNSDSLTKSASPGNGDRINIRNHEFLKINHNFGYEPNEKLAKLHLSYAAEPKSQKECPLCSSSRVNPKPFLKDRYGLPVVFAQCSHCGHVYQGGQPSPRWWHEFYSHYYWPIYGIFAAQTLENELSESANRYEQIIRKLKLIGLNPTVILDAGTGTGGIFSAASKHFPNSKVLGTDIFKSEDLRIKQVDWQSEKYPCNADLVISVHSLEHTHDPKSVLKNLRASASPDHYLYIEVPDLRSPHADPKTFFHIAHVQYFDTVALKQILYKSGYRPIQIIRGHVKEWPWTIGILAVCDNAKDMHPPKTFIHAQIKRLDLRLQSFRQNRKFRIRHRISSAVRKVIFPMHQKQQ